MTDEAAAAVDEPKKGRSKPNSPTAPGIGLATAISETTKAYDKYSHGSFNKSELASSLGMSGTSGPFSQKLGTLREFGLLTDVGSDFRVSETFIALAKAERGSADAKRAALGAIRNSDVFSRLLQYFPTKIPDEATIAMRLEVQEKFNHDRAQVVARAFRTSVSDFGLIDASGNLIPVRDTPSLGGAPVGPGEAEAAKDPIVEGPAEFRVEVPLGKGRRARISLPEDLAPSDVKRIASVLMGYVSED